MNKEIWKSILSMLFSYMVYAIIALVIYFDWTGKVDGGSAILGAMLFWFYYEINSKDLQLQEFNKAGNLSFSLSGLKAKLKSLSKK